MADLVGNVWEWQHLFKIQDGQIILASDNYYDQDEANWPARGSYFDDPEGTLTIAGSVGTTGSGGVTPWTDVAVASGHTFESPVLQAGLTPYKDGDATSVISVFSGILGRLYVDNTGERFPRCGGTRSLAGNAGLAALSLGSERSNSYHPIGFRPAFLK